MSVDKKVLIVDSLAVIVPLSTQTKHDNEFLTPPHSFATYIIGIW